MDFEAMLQKFTAAVESGDGDALADLFVEDGVYDDYFFGPQKGRQAIKEMLAHFYDGGARFKWDFYALLADDRRGYARYRFSYDSKHADANGVRVTFDGMGCFTLRDGKIAHYCEAFDRGMALAQQNFAGDRIAKIGRKFADRLKADPAWATHVK